MDRLDAGGRAGVATLARYIPLRTEIESFWMHPEHRRTSTWIEHADINDVMLAASLVPDGFLALVSPATFENQRLAGTGRSRFRGRALLRQRCFRSASVTFHWPTFLPSTRMSQICSPRMASNRLMMIRSLPGLRLWVCHLPQGLNRFSQCTV